MMLKKTALTLALSLGLVAGASASNLDIDVGTINPGDSFAQVIQKSVGSFLDKWSFNVAQTTATAGSVSNLSIKLPGLNMYNIADLAVNLYSTNNTASTTDDFLIQTLAGTADYKSGSGVFPTGGYYFTVAGTADGNFGGQYVFAATALPVPEPETYAMLLAGLGLMGTIARRRSKSKAV